MRVISQDGKYDFPYESIILELMADGNMIYAYTGTGQPFRVADYSTKPKSLKAMELVRNAYESSLYSDHAYDNAAQVQRPYIFIYNVVFQFPKDEDVEV